MSSVVSLFLLSQVFLIMGQQPLVHVLADIILHGRTDSLFLDTAGTSHTMPGFVPPTLTLEQGLEDTNSGEQYK